MRDERPADPLTPSAIDRELERALAVEPSPQFVVRVRMHIANEPAPRSWWGPWMPVASGALVAAAAVVIAIVGSQKIGSPTALEHVADVRLPPDAAMPAAPSPPAARLPAAPSSAASLPAVRSRGASRPSPTTNVARTMAVTRTAEPEVLVSQAEAAAFRRLLVRASEGKVVEGSLFESIPDAGPGLRPLPEIVIPLITVDPIVSEKNVQGVLQ